MSNTQFFERINVITAEKSMKNKSNNREHPSYMENIYIILGKKGPEPHTLHKN